MSTAGFPRRLWHLRHTLKPPTVSPLSKATLPRAPARRWSATQRWSKGFDRARRHRATRGARPRRPRCAQRSCRPRCGDSARAWPPRQSPSRRDAQTRPRVALSRRERERYIYIYIYIRFADICIRFGDTRDVVLFGVIRRKYVLDSILSLVTAPARRLRFQRRSDLSPARRLEEGAEDRHVRVCCGEPPHGEPQHLCALLRAAKARKRETNLCTRDLLEEWGFWFVESTFEKKRSELSAFRKEYER